MTSANLQAKYDMQIISHVLEKSPMDQSSPHLHRAATLSLCVTLRGNFW